jgi:hypothetical protein
MRRIRAITPQPMAIFFMAAQATPSLPHGAATAEPTAGLSGYYQGTGGPAEARLLPMKDR